jgi:hypothetical protein
MKKLILKFILPLTIISFVVITKWWKVEVIDGPTKISYGFPLIYISSGANSISYEFFFLELIVDFLTYFLIWFVVIYFINRLKPILLIKQLGAFSIILYAIAGIIMCSTLFFFTSFDVNVFLNRKQEGEKIIETGYHFIWNENHNNF